jgi:hypothetical protein
VADVAVGEHGLAFVFEAGIGLAAAGDQQRGAVIARLGAKSAHRRDHLRALAVVGDLVQTVEQDQRLGPV